MKRVSSYLKMRVLGAIESAPGNTIVARIRHVSEQVFLDEDGQRFQFTWRTIQTWYSRYKKDGTTTVLAKPRSDKGKTRKMTPEEVLEAVDQVRGCFRGRHNVTAVYRACIERGLLQRERIAPNTFRRVVKAHELLKADAEVEDKRRLASAKAHANELWQADHHGGPLREPRRGQSAEQAHRVSRRREPRRLPRRLLPRRQHRSLAQVLPKRALQARPLRVPLRRQRQ
jgi:hypothetical protein